MELGAMETELDAISRAYKLSHTSFDRKPSPLHFSTKSVASDCSSSKAVAGAMNALQEKIRKLEEENERLRRNTIELEERYFRDKEEWSKKVLSEIERWSEIDKRYEISLREINIEVHKLRGQVQELEGENSFIRSQRMQPQLQIPSENERAQYEERLAETYQELKSKTVDLHNLESAIRRTEQERDAMFNDLQTLEVHNKELTNQLQTLHQRNGLQATETDERLYSTQAQLNEAKAAHAHCSIHIAKLKEKNRTLKHMQTNQTEQIALLKDQLDKQQFAYQSLHQQSLSQTDSRDGQNSSRKRRVSRQKRVRTVSPPKERPRLRHTWTKSHLWSITNDDTPQFPNLPNSPYKQKAFTITLPRYNSKKTDRLSVIDSLQNELSGWKKSYKELLSQSKGSNRDIQSLRVDLNRLAGEIEDKSGQILELKHRYKDMQQTNSKIEMELSDSKPRKPTIPKLSFSHHEQGSDELFNVPPDFDDIAMPTSFRMHSKEVEEERLPEQIHRLNSILEGVMGGLFAENPDISVIECQEDGPDMKTTMSNLIGGLKAGDMSLMVDLEEFQGWKTDLEKVYEFEIGRMKADLENLTNTQLPEFTHAPSRQLPKFCSEVQRLIADIIGDGVKKCHVKTKLRSTLLNERLSVSWKVKELESINRKLLELANEVHELGESKTCRLKLGNLELNLTVDHDPCLKTTTMKQLLENSKLDESILNVSMISQIADLEAHVEELEAGLDFQMKDALNNAEADRIRELEFKIEKLTSELEAERARNRWTNDNEDLYSFRANRDNLYDLEIKLLKGTEALKLERDSFEKQKQEVEKESMRVKEYKSECDKEFEGLKAIIEELQTTGMMTDRENEPKPFSDITKSTSNEEAGALKQMVSSITQLHHEESAKLDKEKSELKTERLKLEEEYIKFNKKKTEVKSMIDKINDRQKKIAEREKLLNEKQLLLNLDQKRLEWHKQAINEEWTRIDEKRWEVLKCHKLIDDEWKILLEETKQFESLKLQDRNVKTEFNQLRAAMNRTEFENVEAIKAKIDIDHMELRQKESDITEEKQSLIQQRKDLTDNQRKLAIQKKELQYDKLNLERERQELEDHRREISLLMPSIKTLMTNSKN